MFLSNVGYYHNKAVRLAISISSFQHCGQEIQVPDEFAIQNGMVNYSQILYNKHRMIPQNINDEYDKNFAFIQKVVKESDADKIVVVTHHLPTFSASNKDTSAMS